MKQYTVNYFKAVDFVPKNWIGWFWERFSNNAPFSWGDNNITLITVERFLQHAEDILEDCWEDQDFDFDEKTTLKKEVETFLDKLNKLDPQAYIALEC